jgi:hypothetical protein
MHRIKILRHTLLFDYIKNHKIRGKSVMVIQYMFYFSLYLFQTFVAL